MGQNGYPCGLVQCTQPASHLHTPCFKTIIVLCRKSPWKGSLLSGLSDSSLLVIFTERQGFLYYCCKIAVLSSYFIFPKRSTFTQHGILYLAAKTVLCNSLSWVFNLKYIKFNLIPLFPRCFKGVN